jgi:hypothetical protein
MRERFTRAAGERDECLGEAAQSDAGRVDGVGDLLEGLDFGALT